jgi:predicted RNA binding protein YcfA (HicA-like mRNA interferase family)
VPGKLRTLSGEDVVRILAGFGFEFVGRRGSHAKLRRVTSEGRRQTLHLPLHEELRKGTLRAIFQQAAMYIPEQDLRPHFYTD